VFGNNGTASRSWIVIDEMTARSVVEEKAVLLKEANDLSA